MQMIARSSWAQRLPQQLVCLCGSFALSATAWAGPLADYLANPPVLEHPPWEGLPSPQESIPLNLKKLAEETDPDERASAVCGLTFAARQMSRVEPAKAAARELLETHVIPNIELTRHVDNTFCCAWRRTVLSCKNTYQNLGDLDKVDEWLTIFENGKVYPQDAEMVCYLRAHLRAKQRRYQEAIDLILTLPAESNWARPRESLIKYWQWNIAKIKDPSLPRPKDIPRPPRGKKKGAKKSKKTTKPNTP